MTMPKRIQRKRTKGWRMPEGAIYVGRGSKWGNPFHIGDPHPIFGWPMIGDEVVALYRGAVEPHQLLLRVIDGRIPPGVDLACWCPLNKPCHADVLLEIANRGAS
jgi:hypothetical protein